MVKQKVFPLLIVFLVFTALLGSCNKDKALVSSNTIKPIKSEKSETFVSWESINEYASRNNPRARSNERLGYTINPVIGERSDTLMYIINYGNGDGWKIISADNRTPAIIAESENGSFTLDSENHSVNVWIECIANDISIIRQTGNDSLNFDEEEILANQSFWTPNHRSQPLEPDPDGYWTESITSEIIVVEAVEHMTPHWDQDTPYNRYCPLNSSDTTKRAPTGCVATAGAEVLYYLHDHLGVPSTMVSQGECVGDINNYYRHFYDENTSIWASMDTNYVSTLSPPYAEALMMGHIGALMGMNYHNSYSWIYPARLRTHVFGPMGISCSHGSYDAAIVKSSLNNGLPVIVTASNLLIPLDFDIHCFVIDGYKKTYTKYKHHHYFIPYDPEMVLPPGVYESYDTYTYSSTDITAIKINWGWSSQWRSVDPLNDGWYTLTDDWNTLDGQGHEISYNYNREMIYGFSVVE